MFEIMNELRYAFVDEQTLILMIVFVSAVFAVLAGAAALAGNDSAGGRMRALVNKERGASLRYGFASDNTRNLMRRLERAVVPTDGRKRTYAQLRLVQAGLYHPHALAVYYAVRCVLALALPMAALVGLPLITGSLSIKAMYLAAVGSSAAGFFGPAFLIGQKVKARQQAVREAFPDTLDMLLVCVEAGLGLNSAISRVSEELRVSSPILSEQFVILNLEMQAGVERGVALRNLSARIGTEEVSALVTLLIQSDSMGISVAQTLRVYASEMRRKRMVRAEEHANKLPVHMVLPLAAFIMPAFLIVITIPTVIRVMRVLLPALQGSGH